jgi:magnesium chelatase family protein
MLPALAPGELESLAQHPLEQSSAGVALRVKQARKRMVERNPGGLSNGQVEMEALRRHCQLAPKARLLWRKSVDGLALSARSAARVLRVARTIADLEDSERLEAIHLAEALTYRCLDRDQSRPTP